MPSNSFTCAHRGGDGDESLYVCSGTSHPDGSLSWSGDSRALEGYQTPDAPALCWYRNVLFTVFRNERDSYLICSISPPGVGIGAAIVGVSSSQPALCVYNDVLYCVWQSSSSNDLWFSTCNSFDPESRLPRWSQGQALGNGSQMICGASLVAYNGYLYCFHRGNKNDDYVFYCYFDGSSWSQDQELKNSAGEPDWFFRSADTPAAVSFDAQNNGNQQLVIVSRGAGNDQSIWTVRMKPAPSQWHAAGHLVAADQQQMPYQTGNLSLYGPNLIVCNGTLYCVHPHDSDDTVIQWTRWRTDNTTWEQDQALPGNGTRAGVGLALTSP